MEKLKKLKLEILEKVRQYAEAVCIPSDFIPGKDKIHYAGRVYDEKEMVNLVDASLDFWLTAGPYAKAFEERFAAFLGVRHCLLVNSGSSANLLAFMTLTSPLLGDRRICRGDEVITAAAGFPTTISPMIQFGAVPVFLDVEADTANLNPELLEQALSPRTKAVMLAHTLGNPFDLERVASFCRKHRLWLVEDNCDALGSRFHGRMTGSFGDLATSSFYPPHHITMGEGGAVYMNDPLLKKIALSLRDWGRDCSCPSGVDNSCGNRFSGQFGKLPFGYDHKYVYRHFGYNLKATDLQAAIGCAQLEKLPEFVRKRRENYHILAERLKNNPYLTFFRARPDVEPSWFGFLMTVLPNAPFGRNEIVKSLEENGIQTRNLFAGNITRHPCFDDLKENRDFRIASPLTNTDNFMNNSFWIGVYPGMTGAHLDYMIQTIETFTGACR